MGLQLIFVVEANKKCQSDWIYIKETIEKFFVINQAHNKLSPIFLDGKGNYDSKEKEIEVLKKKYQETSNQNKTKVIMCLDCDDYDIDVEDATFLENVKKYCDVNDMELVWFCKDIERVYIGKKVPANEKKDEAVKFKSKKLIEKVDKKKLMAGAYTKNSSNLVRVLRKYLEER